jgi:hypothetical protein
MEEMNLFSASGILGYGFPEASLVEGLRRGPHMLGCDAGSTDPGPHYLGAGKPFVSRQSCRRDTRLLLRAATQRKIPLIIGSAGGAGGRDGLQWQLEIVKEIAHEEDLHFRLAVIEAEVARDLIKHKVSQGKVHPLPGARALAAETVDQCAHIVGMMGAEPIMHALEQGADVVVAGRSSDTAIFAALPLMRHFPAGLAWHAAKILECGAHSTETGYGGDSIMVTLKHDSFEVEPMNPQYRHTVASTAAHAMYENTSPYEVREPSGTLDLSAVAYEQITDRRVRVSGSRFVPAAEYTVKLEGARLVGYRTICMCGTRDPILIGQIDSFLDAVSQTVKEKAEAAFGRVLNDQDYSLSFRQYGRNAVMGCLEREDVRSLELGVLIEVVARDPQMSRALLALGRSNLLHQGFPGRLCTAGNMAVAFSPSDIYMGPTYQFCLNHVVEVDDPLELFPMEVLDI